MVSLKEIDQAIQSLDCGGEKPSLDAAIMELRNVIIALDELTVQGRESVDVLSGCYILLDQIMGKEE